MAVDISDVLTSGSVGASTMPESHQKDGLVLLRRIGFVALAIQLLLLGAFSYVQYRRFVLTADFAQYAQAWYMIAHGHINPWDSITRAPFWRNNGEFVLWPLALLYYVHHYTLDLLWAQDVAVVATEAIAFTWALEALAKNRVRVARRSLHVIGGALLVGLLLDPWVYATISFDFHTEPFAALFAVLCGWSMWRGRYRRAVLAGAACLLCYGPAGLYVAAVGLSSVLATRQARRVGAVLVTIGLGWVLGLSALGGDMGSGTRFTNGKYYGYLTGFHKPHFGMLGLAVAVAQHPVLAVSHLASRWAIVVAYLAVVGLVGVCSEWAFPMVLAVFLPSALAASLEVMKPFQVWPALPFVLVGSVEVLLWLAVRWERTPALRFVAAAWVTAVVPIATVQLPRTSATWLSVSPPIASELASVRSSLPAHTEVVVSQGISGRFGLRPAVEPFSHANQRIAITEETVAFIFTSDQGVDEPSSSATAAAERTVVQAGGVPILDDRALRAYLWSKQDGRRTLILP